MRKPELVLLMLCIAFIGKSTFAQNSPFKLKENDHQLVKIDESFVESTVIKPFHGQGKKIYGLAATAEINFTSAHGEVKLVLLDNDFNEFLLLESYPNLEGKSNVLIENHAEESALLDGVTPYAIEIVLKDAVINLKQLNYATKGDIISNYNKQKKVLRLAQNQDKIKRLNKNLKANGQGWIAGETSVSQLSYGERKKLYGQSTFPAGMEFYAGGVIVASSTSESEESSTLKSVATSSPYVGEWDWRNRHGKNWITSIKNQGSCGSCWAFAAAGATEAITNLFFNQNLNLDLSEQDLLSCSGAGDCDGGSPYSALNYITTNGIVDEAAFSYTGTEQDCNNKSLNPTDIIKIGGKIDFGFDVAYDEDLLKQLIIEQGPVSGGVGNWYHAMTLVGYKVVQEGDVFYCRDINLNYSWVTISADDRLVGKLVWIFKNSWGKYYGEEGYVYVETPITNINWTHALKTPVTSVVNNYEVQCTDNDGDGYYFWGLGEKPANCPDCPDLADGDDSDPTKGPLDEYGFCLPINGAPAPVADFTSTATSINKGQTVTFTDQSNNNPTSWQWSFVGGTPATSTEQNPQVTYNTAGSFNVSLTVSNANGDDTQTITNYINVIEPVSAPTANFSATPATINEGSEVSFTDLTTNNPTSWSWTFTGGTPATSNAQHPKVTYSLPGNYNVTLTVNNAGGTNTKTINNCIQVLDTIEAPIANFTASNTLISEGQAVTFTDLSSNSPSEWNWIFEGGTPASSSEQNPTVVYSGPGLYNVTLTATSEGGTNTIIREAYITVNDTLDAPAVNFTANTTTIDEGKAVGFTDLTTNNPTQWNWTFEGGTPATSTVQHPTVLYSTPGSYKVTLTATNDAGSNSTTKDAYITVEDTLEAPVADFEANITAVVEGGEITFNDKSKNTPTSWEWKFEGGTPSTSAEQHPKVKYNAASSYKVSLTVTNQAGNHTKTVENYITVEAAPEPEYCSASPTSTDEWIAEVHFGDNSNISGSDGYGDYTSTAFSVEAGSICNLTLVPGFSSRSKFEYWGIWIDFNLDMNFTEDEKVFSSSKSKSSVSGTIVLPEEILTTRMRIAMGRATPSACNFSDLGEVEDYTLAITAPVPVPPVADFSANTTAIEPGQQVQFTNLSENEPGSYKWYFPGGNPSESTASNPLVSYPTAGNYDVSLIAYKDGFTPSEVTKTAYITVTEGETVPVPVSYCEPEMINSTLYYINQLNIGGIITSQGNGGGFSIDNNAATLSAGKTYSVELVPNKTTSRNFWRIWVDLNNDGDFDDADETLLSINNKKGTISASITLPYSAAETTRMRVAMKAGSSPAPCEDDYLGEVEDYVISFASQQMQSTMPQASAMVTNMQLRVYPNPINNLLNLQLSGNRQNAYYSIYNAVGEKIIEQAVDSPLSTIDMGGKAPGIFIVVVQTETQTFKEKVIKR